MEGLFRGKSACGHKGSPHLSTSSPVYSDLFSFFFHREWMRSIRHFRNSPTSGFIVSTAVASQRTPTLTNKRKSNESQKNRNNYSYLVWHHNSSNSVNKIKIAINTATRGKQHTPPTHHTHHPLVQKSSAPCVCTLSIYPEYVLHVCTLCMYPLYPPCVCTLCVYRVYVPYVCILCMYPMCVSCVYILCVYPVYVPDARAYPVYVPYVGVCTLCMHPMHACIHVARDENIPRLLRLPQRPWTWRARSPHPSRM